MSDPSIVADMVIDRQVARENEEIAKEIAARLDALAELQAQAEVLRLNRQQALDSVLTPEIRLQMAEIEAEYAPEINEAADRINHLQEDVKRWTLRFGESVKGQRLHAVYVKGRESWDSRGLQGYAKARPEVLDFQHIGEPSVSIRKV